MIFLIGLRNEGEDYKNTVHNLGEEFILRINSIVKKIFYSYIDSEYVHNNIAYTEYGYKFNNDIVLKLILMNGFINNTGANLLNCTELVCKIKRNLLFIVYDDLLLPTGVFKACKIKLNTKHNGVLGIINNRITDEIYGLRIGITKNKDIITKDFVLSKISADMHSMYFYQYIIYLLDFLTDDNTLLNDDNFLKYLQQYKIS
jgi:peptidyl-tRNA hydrolase